MLDNMVQSCCVDGCEAKDVTYFSFPNSRARRSKWMSVVNLDGRHWVNALVCSAHFLPEDMVFVRGKVRLKPKVVPSVFGGVKNNLTNNSSNATTEGENISEHNAQPGRLEVDNVGTSAGENEIRSVESNCESDKLVVEQNEEVEEDLRSVENNHENEKAIVEQIKEVAEDTRSTREQEIVAQAIKPSSELSEKHDIEDILAYFHIKQNKEVAERQNAELEKEKSLRRTKENGNGTRDENGRRMIEIEIPPKDAEKSKPVYIEVPVDQRPNDNPESDNADDCFMVLESLQVELDPSELLLPEKDEISEIDLCDKSEDPISLLTSSDEDDVIIQEPHIDTIEVSDEDEDDLPLTKLVTPPARPRRRTTCRKRHHCCPKCQFRTSNRVQYRKHLAAHDGNVILICQLCSYTTSSKGQLNWHRKKKHTDEKQYQCRLCKYKAKYKMSLLYHMKTHSAVPMLTEL